MHHCFDSDGFSTGVLTRALTLHSNDQERLRLCRTHGDKRLPLLRIRSRPCTADTCNCRIDYGRLAGEAGMASAEDVRTHATAPCLRTACVPLTLAIN